MTLFNQINSLLFAIFLLVISSLVYFQFTETKEFMNNQMESDLNNTSTSLSLMLKPHLETGDVATVETLINVVFEGGFYKKVHLTWIADNKEQEWLNPVKVKSVPQWFVDLALFKGQIKETTISSGWLQLATLKIESNPAIGYRELWRIMNNTIMLLAALFLVSLLLLRLRLKTILKPLNDVAIHAQQIAQRKFSAEMPLPKTTELETVVVAVNSMSAQLKQVFSALDDEVDFLKTEKLSDPVSQLPNRLHLLGRLNSWLDNPGLGGLLIADLAWLEELHHRFGYQVRDDTIRILATNLKQNLPDGFIARISKNELVFLIDNAEQEQITEYLQALIRLINQEMLKAGCQPNRNFAIGVSQRTLGVSSADLLSQADNALQKAILENKTSDWFHIESGQKRSQNEWRTRLTTAINENQFILQWQPVHLTENSAVMHREIYCRLQVDNEVIRANEFMPYIERLSLGHQLDQCLLNAIISTKVIDLNQEPIAVNLARDSIANVEFHRWLNLFLQKISHPERMHFELPEAGVISDLESAITLCGIITKCGAKFGVDNCGRQMDSLDYLQKLQPYYVKLDLSLSCYDSVAQQDNLQNLELGRALVNIARGLDIKVIITGIEDKKHLERVKPLRATGYQGYIFSPTEIHSQ